MKSDKEIQKDVMDQLAFDPAIDSECIGVSVKDRIVTLGGTVPSYFEKYEAEKRAFRVAGVKSVVDEIEVKLAGSHIYDDFDIARIAADSLEWNVLVPNTVKASVADGIVTLRGEAEFSYQRDSAEDSVRHIKGVKAVQNFITLASAKSPKPDEVKSKIEKALTRLAKIEAKGIKVDVSDQTVTLTGHVRSHDESEEAKWAAWSIPGITKVENQLIVD